MNPQTQGSPSKPFDDLPVLDVHGDDIDVKIGWYGEDHGALAVSIFQHGGDTTRLTLWPMEATHLAHVLLEAAEAARDWDGPQ